MNKLWLINLYGLHSSGKQFEDADTIKSEGYRQVTQGSNSQDEKSQKC